MDEKTAARSWTGMDLRDPIERGVHVLTDAVHEYQVVTDPDGDSEKGDEYWTAQTFWQVRKLLIDGWTPPDPDGAPTEGGQTDRLISMLRQNGFVDPADSMAMMWTEAGEPVRVAAAHLAETVLAAMRGGKTGPIIHMARKITKDSWLQDDAYFLFRLAYSYASSRTRSIEPLARISPEQVFWLYQILQRGFDKYREFPLPEPGGIHTWEAFEIVVSIDKTDSHSGATVEEYQALAGLIADLAHNFFTCDRCIDVDVSGAVRTTVYDATNNRLAEPDARGDELPRLTDQQLYEVLLRRFGFVDGGEVTGDGSAGNDLAHAKASDALALIRSLDNRPGR